MKHYESCSKKPSMCCLDCFIVFVILKDFILYRSIQNNTYYKAFDEQDFSWPLDRSRVSVRIFKSSEGQCLCWISVYLPYQFCYLSKVSSSSATPQPQPSKMELLYQQVQHANESMSSSFSCGHSKEVWCLKTVHGLLMCAKITACQLLF